ncbi:MAG: hypothetical protein WCX73_01505 [Candidatus Pacearchaeota archaeon]|jgi:hypothetical protein
MEEKIRMISAAARVIEFRKRNPLAIDEEIFQDVSDYISQRKDIKDEKIKVGMVAAAAKAFKISKENPKLNEKQILRKVMEEIPALFLEISQEEIK